MGGCAYLDTAYSQYELRPGTAICMYCGITGSARGCPCGEGCSRHTALAGTSDAVNATREAQRAFMLPGSKVRRGFHDGWTPPNKKVDDRKFRELYEQGLDDGRIGAALGLPRGTITSYRRRKNIPRNHEPWRTRKEAEHEPAEKDAD
jgi:hypothetical protein